jgi:hypothetical protein
MSFFLQMACTRTGAERLLEAQLLPILGVCDFLDARPDGDQAFIGRFYMEAGSSTYVLMASIRPRRLPALSNAEIPRTLHASPSSYELSPCNLRKLA